jgi:hypothetical protein
MVGIWQRMAKSYGIAAAMISMMVAAGSAQAGVITAETIIGLSISTATNFQGQSGFVVVYLSGTETNKPACDTGSYASFAINAGTTAGAAVIAQLIATQAQGRTISITGTGTCTLTPGVEDLYSTTVN